ncbi:MAG: heterodisulfide reductase-related iron-sulfur binding cluster [Aigarchaeota archaeon]|nr:heterodisulfide reductase-related iron-sulfur binding cluster [Candidatus Caldarchaeales archaeon]
MEPIRETYILLPPGTDFLMYLVLVPFALVFVFGVVYRLRRLGVRSVGELLNSVFRGVGYMARYGLLQRKVVSEHLAGVMHLLIYTGIIALFIGTTLVFIDHDILRVLGLRLLRGDFYLGFEFVLDVMGVAFLLGLALLIYRRFIRHEPRLRNRLEYSMALAGLLFIGLSGYVLEAIRLTVEPRPWSGYSFVGKAVSTAFFVNLPTEPLTLLYRGIWWSHAIVAFAMVAVLPYSPLGHIFSTLLNIAVNAPRQLPLGKMKTPFRIDELDPSADIKLGFRSLSELGWMEKLGLDACTDCGRCEAACPAHAAGTPLSPRDIVQKLRRQLWRSDGLDEDVFASGLIDEEEVWACTTCSACIEACPVLIRPMDYILEMRRALTLEGKLDKRKTAMLTNLSRYGNPYGFDQSEKEKFFAELSEMGVQTLDEKPDAEYVYWIGCASIYDARGREIAKSVAKILLKAGVSFAVLGVEETCTGDPARRIGEEGRFQELALQNIETLKQKSVKKIIVNCPHCFNTLKKEYRDFGLELEVKHHSQLIGELLRTGRLKLTKPLSEKITLHDSCYIGRVNDVFEEPRFVIQSANKDGAYVEMSRNGRKSFCCGAGGSTYWYEVRRTDRESVIRLREAVETGASILAVECPYCMQMFADAARVTGVDQSLKIKDIAEIVAESI